MLNLAVGMVDPRGVIVNYRIAYTKEVIVKIPGIDNKRGAKQLVGRKVIWTDEKGRKYSGIVSGIHGSSGSIRVKFRFPLPPKALAKPVDVAG